MNSLCSVSFQKKKGEKEKFIWFHFNHFLKKKHGQTEERKEKEKRGGMKEPRWEKWGKEGQAPGERRWTFKKELVLSNMD